MSRSGREEAGREARLVQRRPRRVAALLTLGALALFEVAVLGVAGGRGSVPDPEPPPAMALPLGRPAAQAVAAGLRRQPFVPPLAAEAVADPGHGPLFTPDLLEVGRPAAPAAAPAAVPVPPAGAALPDEHVIPEPPPSEAQPLEIDLPTPVPVRLELDGSCRRVALGPIRFALRCRR